MRRFTVDLERVLEVPARNDRDAALKADFIDSAVDRAIRELYSDTEFVHGHTQAYRGTGGGRIYDSQEAVS